MINVNKYKNLLLKSNNSIDTYNANVKTHVPSPTDTDFKKGYIVRYFAQKANDPSSYIFEINKNEYSNLVTNAYFVLVKLDWRLVGNADEVRESNSKSVQFASNKLKSISLYLPNKLQFYKR